MQRVKKMLQTIRDVTQGWVATLIISIVILSFALWGIHSYFGVGGGNSDVVEVNGTTITKEQLALASERLRKQMQAQHGSNNPFTAKDESSIKERALQALINIEVLKQASLNQGFLISDRQVDTYLASMPEFQVDGRFSFERFQAILSTTLLSTSEFLDLIKTSLLIDQPRLGILLTSFALPNDTRYAISLVNQEREIEYLMIPLQTFLSQPITISPDKIKAYYEDHKNDFMTPDQVNVEYIELLLKDVAQKINPSETVLKNFYNENINAYAQSTQWKLTSLLIPVAMNATPNEIEKAQSIAQQIKTTDDFNKFSHQYPDTMLHQNWMMLNQVPTEYQKVVSQMTKAEQLSTPFKTNKGFVIVKVVNIQEPKMQSYETVKDKVKEGYIRQHAEEKFAELRDQLADVSYEHPDSLQAAAKALNLPIKTSDLFTKEKGSHDISQYKKVRETAFSNDVLRLQNNSDAIQLNPETIIVLRLKSHIPSAMLPLSDVSKQITEKLKAQEAETRAGNFAQTLKAKLQSGANPEQLAKEHHLTWNKTGLLGRYSSKVDSAILDMAFRLPKPNKQNHAVFDVTRLPMGYAIVTLKSVKEGTITNRKQNDVFAEQFQNSEGLLEYELYKQSQTNRAKVKYIQ